MWRKKRQIKVASEAEQKRAIETKAKAALVVSVVSLSPFQRREIEQILAGLFGGIYKIENRLDDSVIGGLYIKIGDKAIDATLRAKIEKLKERLLP